MGVLGGFGVGKTSFLNKVQRKIIDETSRIGTIADEKKPDVLSVFFNPWRFENEENLLLPFLYTIHKEFFKNKLFTDTNISASFRALLRGVTFKTPFFNFDSDKASVAEQKLSEWLSIENECRSSFVGQLDLLKSLTQDAKNGVVRKVVVFIDDLDRCSPKKALYLLEQIKLMTDVEGFIFVLALDPRYIFACAKEKYSADLIHHSEYFEKIIQIPFNIPSLSKDDVFSYLNHIDSKYPNYKLQETIGGWGLLPHNLRRIKRIVNTYYLFSFYSNNINAPISFALSILNIKYPDVFELLMTHFRYGMEYPLQQLSVDNVLKKGVLLEIEESNYSLLLNYLTESTIDNSQLVQILLPIVQEYTKPFFIDR